MGDLCPLIMHYHPSFGLGVFAGLGYQIDTLIETWYYYLLYYSQHHHLLYLNF